MNFMPYLIFISFVFSGLLYRFVGSELDFVGEISNLNFEGVLGKL